MNVITLISDLGTKDYYLAAVKARALSLVPDMHWVDISHHIPPFDLAKAAFVLKNVWHEFPTGTIHIISVDSDWNPDRPFVVLKKDGHFFIGADTGIFALVFDGAEADAIHSIQLKGDEDMSFPTKSVFIEAAAKIASGTALADIGPAREDYLRRTAVNPVVEYQTIRGTVIYVDSYGNVITNITRELFENVVGSKPFNIALRRGDNDLNKISRAYNEVPEGEKLAIFSGGGYLEIAINRGVEGSGGGASDLLGLEENDIVRVEIGE
jgi:S-adenosylmethionine hydrolase